MPFEKELSELRQRKASALKMGGPEKIKHQHAQGKLNARERIDHLLDKDSFLEVGILNCSDVPGMEDKTPADSKIAGYGKIDGRTIAILANDFTVMAATSSRVAGRKEGDIKHTSVRKGFPLVYLGEAGGARMPDIMGAKGLASFGGGGYDTFLHMMSRVRKSPLVAAVMGECYGMPTWVACLADFVVQVKGSAMGVSGPRVLELAIGEKITDEELGGWKVHAEITGNIDRVAENEEECFALIREYLSYMPSHRDERPPTKPVPKDSGNQMDKILDILPPKRNRAYDMNKLLSLVVDGGALFPIKPLFAKSVITSLARIGGEVVGIVANQPSFNAGAIDTNGIDKIISFLVLCDSYNIPLLFFEDTPGFLVGQEAERNRVGARVMNYMNALGQITVPKITVIIRKAYGMAFWNMAGTGCATEFIVAWPTAEMSFVSPEIAANVVFAGKMQNSPELANQKEKYVAQMLLDSAPYSAAGMHYIHDVIDPRQTRSFIIRALDICRDRRTDGLSSHLLANWPTKF
jgi:acetyl-CoA carboxylase carboxyltransferase component